MGKYDEAIKFYDKALVVDPKFVKALANKGVAIADNGDLSGSLTYFDQAIALDANDFLNYYNKGTVLSDLGFETQNTGFSTQAIEAFDKAITIKPEYVDAYVYKAITFNDLKDYTGSLEWADKAVAKKNDHENAWYYKA